MNKKQIKQFKQCCVCHRHLNKRNIYGGIMGFMYRIFFKVNTHEFSTCQECRDLYSVGYNIEQIKQKLHK